VRAFVFLACFVVPVSVAAQGSKSPPANVQQSGATKGDTKTPAQQSKGASADTKARPGNTRPLPGNTRPIPPRPGATPATRPAITVAPEADARVDIAPIMREAYDYDAGGRRDPFVSLLNSEDLRPMISDLRLVSILYDESGRRPIAVMRDVQNNTQYRVTTGSTLGRLKVALIKRKAVIFSIEEFGMNRQDSLVLGDTTKARTR
jgi:hypothetical protein